jgi:hypothetical protein
MGRTMTDPIKYGPVLSAQELNKVAGMLPVDAVNHPPHYGGEDDPYEAIKVIEAWGLGFHLGNTVKYISRAGKKTGAVLLEDLRKARWYIDRKIKQLEASE